MPFRSTLRQCPFFYGEDGKCEAACGMVRFKFESILAAETFAPAEINFGIRRTVKDRQEIRLED